MGSDKKTMKKMSGKIKRMMKSDSSQIQNEEVRELIEGSLNYLAVMLDSMAGSATKKKDEEE